MMKLRSPATVPAVVEIDPAKTRPAINMAAFTVACP